MDGKIVEIEKINETTIDIEAKSDELNSTQPVITPHNGKKIDQIIISPDMSYAVTYSEADYSIIRWIIDIDEIELSQQIDVFYKPEDDYYIFEIILYRNILLYRYYVQDRHFNSYNVGE